MKTIDLDYIFPEELIATEPKYPPRVLFSDLDSFLEITWPQFLDQFQKNDILVLNNSKVVPRRIFAQDLEILFLAESAPNEWEVLFPSRKYHVGDRLLLPENIEAELVSKGRPQIIRTSKKISSDYFFKHAELPLPPYIQKARNDRHNKKQDIEWYQTAYATNEGSLAAPTAGLHFKQTDLSFLKTRNIEILPVTLHIGLGTFLPLQTENVEDHPIHTENFEIEISTYNKLIQAKKTGRKIWSLGTTTTRVLETLIRFDHQIEMDSYRIHQTEANLIGATKMYLYPGKEFYFVDHLITNFHQPGSSLMAMVSAFAGLDHVKAAYKMAIQNKFKLFSYGDLSVWKKNS